MSVSREASTPPISSLKAAAAVERTRNVACSEKCTRFEYHSIDTGGFDDIGHFGTRYTRAGLIQQWALSRRSYLPVS